jgi:hypothetical protein
MRGVRATEIVGVEEAGGNRGEESEQTIEILVTLCGRGWGDHGKGRHRRCEATIGSGSTVWNDVRGVDARGVEGWEQGRTCDDIDDDGFDVCFGALAALLEKWVDDFALARVGQGRVAGGPNGFKQRHTRVGRREAFLRDVAVHELKLDAVGVEERCELDDFKVLQYFTAGKACARITLLHDCGAVHPLGALVHGAAVVDKHDQIEQRKLGRALHFLKRIAMYILGISATLSKTNSTFCRGTRRQPAASRRQSVEA